MFPQFEVKINEETTETTPRRKTVAFDFSAGEFLLQDGRTFSLTGQEALQMRIEKCLRTVAGKHEIYQQDSALYGVSTFDLTSRQYPYAFLCAEIEREVTEALLRDTEILAVNSFEFYRVGRTLTVAFTVESIYSEEEASHQWQIV